MAESVKHCACKDRASYDGHVLQVQQERSQQHKTLLVAVIHKSKFQSDRHGLQFLSVGPEQQVGQQGDATAD